MSTKTVRTRAALLRVRDMISLLVVVVATARCDIPTEAPSFAVNPSVRVPLIFSEGFVLIGPNAEGFDGLIDTTSADFDSLFMVDPTDRSVYITQSIDNFDLGSLDGLIDPVDLGAVSFETGIGQFESQDFASSFEETVGVQVSDPAAGPSLPPDMSTGQVLFPAETSALLEIPSSTLLDLSDADVTEFEVSADGGGFNQLTFDLTNNQAEPLTDGSFVPGSTPDVVVEFPDGTEITRVSFPISPANGQTTSATIDLSGLALPADSRYRFDVGTASGMAPITGNPTSIAVAASITETHYDAFTLSSLKPQTAVDLSQPTITVESDYDFHGAVTNSGQISLTISNDLPVPITIQQLEIRNVDAVDGFPAGHVVATTSGQNVGARSSAVVNLPLGQTGVAANIEAIAFAASPGSNAATHIRAVDAIRVQMNASTQLDRILIRPAAEEINEGATFAFDVQDISMNDPEDFVEFDSGLLVIDELVNEMDVSLSNVQLSFPGIRTGAFGPADTLVVTIPGGMPRSSTRSNVLSINMADKRIYATGNELTYHITAVSEDAQDVRTINVSDKISGSISGTNLVPRELVADINPFDVDLGTDANNNGFLDIMDDAEAQVTELGLDQIASAGVSDLRLADAELGFAIATDVAADFVLYGAIVGVAADGSPVYLGGRGEHAVTQAEANANPLHASGNQISAGDMIKIDITGATTIGQIVQRNVLLRDANSTITDFVGNLPENIRFVGRAVFQPSGGKVQIRDEFVLTAGLDVSIPIAIRESFAVNKTVDADLSSLADLSQPGSDVAVNRAELLLDYTNAMPIGVGLRMNFVDGSGNTVLTLPDAASPAFEVTAGTTNGSGFTTQSTSGSTSFSVSADDLQTIANSTSIRMEITASTGSSGVGRIRADDKIELALSGNFDITVNVGQ